MVSNCKHQLGWSAADASELLYNGIDLNIKCDRKCDYSENDPNEIKGENETTLHSEIISAGPDVTAVGVTDAAANVAEVQCRVGVVNSILYHNESHLRNDCIITNTMKQNTASTIRKKERCSYNHNTHRTITRSHHNNWSSPSSPHGSTPHHHFSTLLRDSFTLKLLVFMLIMLQSAYATSQLEVARASGVSGRSAKLQCVVTQRRPGVTPVLVLWYRNGARRPFYTLDLRSGGGSNSEEYVAKSYKGRISSATSGVYLELKDLMASDAGLYRCRVDFENSPTLSALVNLTVYEVPSQLIIQDEHRKSVLEGQLSRLKEGDKLTVYCVSSGGRPAPRVSWWSGDMLLADRSFVLDKVGTILASQEMGAAGPGISGGRVGLSSTPLSFDESMKVPGLGFREGSGPPYVITELLIPSLNKDHAGVNITCKASNNNITQPLETSISLEVYLHPTSVEISSLYSGKMLEGKESRLECVATGSVPGANITWSKTVNGVNIPLPSSPQPSSHGRSVSRTRFIPEASDHGATVTCRAVNPYLGGQGAETYVTLDVKFGPRVNLHLGTSLVGLPITETEDVYFDCEVQSNPNYRTIVWKKDDEIVTQNLKAGILVSEKNLVLQRVHRTSAGNYTCTVTNDMGTATSKPAELSIRFLPVCANEASTVAVGEGESASLNCQVEAHPIDELSFVWFFNNTLDTMEVKGSRVAVEGDHSVLEYTPQSARDYGTLSCWATNVVGTQAEPCRFTVIEAGPPESVRDCMLVNHTVGALEVRCSPGGDGGSQQRFVAKVFASPTHTELAVLEAAVPKFHVTGLVPGQDYLVTITAVNDKGASEPEQIDAIRLKVAEKRMGDVKAVGGLSPLVGIFLGLVGGFIIILLAVILHTKLARSRGSSCSCFNGTPNNGGNTTGGVTGSDGAGNSGGAGSGGGVLTSTGGLLHTASSPSSNGHSMKNSNSMGLMMGGGGGGNRTAGSPHTESILTTLHRQQLYGGLRHGNDDIDEDEEDGPDLVKTSTETAQLLGFGKCPELLSQKRPPSYLESTKGMITPTQVLSQASSPALGESYLDCSSPHRLPPDESFV